MPWKQLLDDGPRWRVPQHWTGDLDTDEMDVFYVARATAEGQLRPAGSVQLGLDRATGEELRAELDRRALRRRRRVLNVAAGVAVDVSCHGPTSGPVRDAVILRLLIDGVEVVPEAVSPS